MHIATTGVTYPVKDPLVRDLFSKLLSTPRETVDYAIQVAQDIADNTSAVSTKLNRDLLTYCPGTPEETHLLDSKAFLYMVGSDDHVEGVESFMEKRKARFRGEIKEEDFPFWPWWDSGRGNGTGNAKL